MLICKVRKNDSFFAAVTRRRPLFVKHFALTASSKINRLLRATWEKNSTIAEYAEQIRSRIQGFFSVPGAARVQLRGRHFASPAHV